MTDFLVNWNEQIPFPAYAENKKFLPLSAVGTLLNDDGRRYALLTYSVNPAIVNLSATTLSVNVCSVGINNWNALIAETHSDQPLSASVSVDNWPEEVRIEKIGNTDVDVRILSFDNNLSALEMTGSFIEVFNNSNDAAYLSWESLTELSDLTARGLPIVEGSYYSIEKAFTSVVVGSVSATDVRVYGHSR